MPVAPAAAATGIATSGSAQTSGGDGGGATGGGDDATSDSRRRQPAPLSPACVETGADLAWLLQRHCYVRAVSVERRPVSGEESAMAKSVIKAPSGGKWTLAETTLRRAMAATAGDASTTAALLGDALGEQHRYEEAAEVFKIAAAGADAAAAATAAAKLKEIAVKTGK